MQLLSYFCRRNEPFSFESIAYEHKIICVQNIDPPKVTHAQTLLSSVTIRVTRDTHMYTHCTIFCMVSRNLYMVVKNSDWSGSLKITCLVLIGEFSAINKQLRESSIPPFSKMSDYVETFVKEKLDPLFRAISGGDRAPPILGATVMPEAPIATHRCPLHGNVLERRTSAEGWEYVECSQKNCPILLPLDRNLCYVIVRQWEEETDRTVRQGNFFCRGGKICKVGVKKKANSTNRGRCYLSCKTCKYFKWIDVP